MLELSGGVGSLPQAPRWNADRRARPSLPSRTPGRGKRSGRAAASADADGRFTRLSAFRLPDSFEPGAIEMEPVPPPAAVRRDRARSFSRFVEQNSGAARRENAFACSLRAPANADAHERASLHTLAATFSHAGAPSRIDGERSPLAGQFERWSGRRDSNPRPQPWQGSSLALT